jgi:tetratricopeptide (TPR) repeat protein
MLSSEIDQLSKDGFKKFESKKYREAADCFQQCVTALDEADLALDAAEMRNNLGVALVRAGEPQAALEALRETDRQFADAGDINRQGMALANQASAFEGLKSYEEAIQYYEKAIECFKESGEKKLLSTTLRNISDLQMKTGKQYQAIASLQSAFQENPEKNLTNSFFKRSLEKVINKITGR